MAWYKCITVTFNNKLVFDSQMDIILAILLHSRYLPTSAVLF